MHWMNSRETLGCWCDGPCHGRVLIELLAVKIASAELLNAQKESAKKKQKLNDSDAQEDEVSKKK